MQHPLSVQALHDWLATQEDRKYDYTASQGCLIYQYLKARGFQVYSVSPVHWRDVDCNVHPLPEHFDDISVANPKIFDNWGWTIRAAQARAQVILSR